MQQVGTANIDGPAGVVKVVASPVGSGGKWIQISRSSEQQSVSGFQGNFFQIRWRWDLYFSAVMFMPAGGGLATIQFEQFGQPVSTLTSFMHIDFTQDNKVRIDDNDANQIWQLSQRAGIYCAGYVKH